MNPHLVGVILLKESSLHEASTIPVFKHCFDFHCGWVKLPIRETLRSHTGRLGRRAKNVLAYFPTRWDYTTIWRLCQCLFGPDNSRSTICPGIKIWWRMLKSLQEGFHDLDLISTQGAVASVVIDGFIGIAEVKAIRQAQIQMRGGEIGICSEFCLIFTNGLVVPSHLSEKNAQ